jgi:hypothetical protein
MNSTNGNGSSSRIGQPEVVVITGVQLPAVNTPQFSWVKSRLPRKPQPVPPIYQPEVISEALYFAAHHERREIYVGMSTVEALVGNKIVPDLADHYLADTGYDSQQTDEPVDLNRRDNLWEPVPGDHGAHGDFDDRASDFSVQLGILSSALSLAGSLALKWAVTYAGRESAMDAGVAHRMASSRQSSQS